MDVRNPASVHASNPERTSPPNAQAAVPREYATLEDALFQAFLMLDAGDVVWSITRPDVELTREQIRRQ